MFVIENKDRDKGSMSGGTGSCPDTPKSLRNNEVIENRQATESGGSQENDNDFILTKTMLEGGEIGDNLLPHAERHVAKFDFNGTTEIELVFKTGNVIKVIEKSDNGWWKGVYEGLIGWFPESYVDPTPLATPKTVDKEVRQRAESASSAADADVERPKNMDETMAAGERTCVPWYPIL